MAVIVNFAVNLQPGLMLIGAEVFQNLYQIANHFLANTPDERRALRRDADHYLATVFPRDRAHDVTEILQPRYQTARRRSGVSHFLGNCGHGEDFFLVEKREKKKLRERNVARRKLLAKTQHKAALHLQNDVGKPFRIRTNLSGRTSCKRGDGFCIQGD